MSASSSSSAATLTSSSAPTINTIIPVSNIVSLKLTPENYSLWKTQLLHYFRGQDLFGHLDGTLMPPSQMINISHPETGTITSNPNPAYSQWLRQDSLILSTLMSSMTEGVLAQIISYDTAQ